MSESDNLSKELKSRSDIPKDNPLLRSKESNIDKVIGSEDQNLAKKRLEAIKMAQNAEKKNKGTIYPPKDNPLLRSKESNIDKVIGSEDQNLAKKRLEAIKMAQNISDSQNRVEKDKETKEDFNSRLTPARPAGNNWIQLGPSFTPNGQTYSNRRVNVTGRVTCIVVDPQNSNTIYLGAAQGGVWKSNDGGQCWLPTSDNALSLAIGAIAIDENNPLTLYAGTGEANFAGDSQYGLGIIKTTDGGNTWQSLDVDTFISSRFSKIVVHPRDSSTVFASISSPRAGVYKSNDGGQSWTRLNNGLPAINTYAATDLIIDPSYPNTAYVAFWGEGVFKTTNLDAAQPNWNNVVIGSNLGDFSRIALGISKSSTNVLYALIADSNYQINNFYQTTDGGNTWNKISLPNGNIGEQGFYNLHVAVHPTNSNIVYLSGISLWKATLDNNSNNWIIEDIGEQFHPDNHAFAFDPTNPNTIFAGSDGGIYRSVDGGNTWDDGINKGLCITQFEFMEQDPTNERLIILGTQDNGTVRYFGSNDGQFYHADEGDGGFVCIDPTQPRNVFHTYFGLRPVFSNQGGDFRTWQDIGDAISQFNSNFYPPLTLDKTNPNNIAIGGEILFIDHSRGMSGWSDRVNLNLSNDFISAINYVNSNLVYIGTTVGKVFRLIKNANNWNVQAINSPPFPNRYIWDIATLPNDDSKLVAVVSGFGTPHVFYGEVQSNGTAQWRVIGGNGNDGLPDIPVNALLVDSDDPNTVYIGTDVGVYRTMNFGNTWDLYSDGLPNVQVYDLRLSPSKRLLRAATHGRGLWEREL